MPLALPPPDDRTFDSLVSDARARIPRLSPEWTNHNAHDPGITLIELLAQLVETDLFRLGRISAAQRRTFLRWFGLEASGPRVASTVVAFAPAGGAAPVPLGSDVELASASGDVLFSTLAAVNVQAARVTALFAGEKRAFGATGPATQVALLEAPVLPLGAEGRDTFSIALDAPLNGDVCLYFWTGALQHDAEQHRRLQAELDAIQRERDARLGACSPSRFDDPGRHHDVDVVWEVYGSSGWTPATVVADETRALTLSGFVRLKVGAAMVPGALAGEPAAYALRVHALRGRFEAPPLLQAILLNAAPARHQSRAFALTLGTSSGRAGQVFRVSRLAPIPAPGVPLVADATTVTVTPAAGTPETYELRLDFDRLQPNAPAVVLDPEGAAFRFGDGRQGRVPPAGARLELVSRVGGSQAGNVAPRTLTLVRNANATVVQPFAATGGASSAEVADLEAELLAELARPTRAASLDDCIRLALETPGVPTGRAFAIADHHPDFPALPALGCITVVVLPNGPGPEPTPTPGFLAAVRAYLGRRRPVTTELHVIGPTYVAVAVRARLHLVPSADANAALADASRKLDALFHPLTGGSDGLGWPAGRSVYHSEVLAILQSVDGVHHVDALLLLKGPDREPQCDDLSLCPTELAAAAPHELTVAPVRIR